MTQLRIDSLSLMYKKSPDPGNFRQPLARDVVSAASSRRAKQSPVAAHERLLMGDGTGNAHYRGRLLFAQSHHQHS